MPNPPAMSIAARHIIMVEVASASTITACLCELCCTERWLEEDGQRVLELDASRTSAILVSPDETPDQEACQIFQPAGEEEYHHKCPNHDVLIRWVQARL